LLKIPIPSVGGSNIAVAAAASVPSSSTLIKHF